MTGKAIIHLGDQELVIEVKSFEIKPKTVVIDETEGTVVAWAVSHDSDNPDEQFRIE